MGLNPGFVSKANFGLVSFISSPTKLLTARTLMDYSPSLDFRMSYTTYSILFCPSPVDFIYHRRVGIYILGRHSRTLNLFYHRCYGW